MDSHGYITAAEARRALREIFRTDSESNLQKALLHALSDDLRPVDGKGRWRPNPLLILLGLLGIAFGGIFFYFGLGGPR